MNVQADKTRTGIVFNIQKYSVHDGPGIRTIVFLKGCSLRCQWCSNPESQVLRRQLAYNPEKCLTVDVCKRCRDICPQGALSVGPDGRMLRDHKACDDCLICADACPNQALNVYGYETTVEEAIRRVEEDDVFYSRSGGGLTLSGGEPFFQEEFALALLREARKHRIDTCVETCGNMSWEVFCEAAPLLNSVFFDIKCMDPEKHRAATGADNKNILANLKRVNKAFPRLLVTVRTPVIPGFNDSREEIAAVVDFVAALPGVEYELLPYHRMGTPKYGYLGREYPLRGLENLSQDTITDLKEFARQRMDGIRSAKAGCGERG